MERQNRGTRLREKTTTENHLIRLTEILISPSSSAGRVQCSRVRQRRGVLPHADRRGVDIGRYIGAPPPKPLALSDAGLVRKSNCGSHGDGRSVHQPRPWSLPSRGDQCFFPMTFPPIPLPFRRICRRPSSIVGLSRAKPTTTSGARNLVIVRVSRRQFPGRTRLASA